MRENKSPSTIQMTLVIRGKDAEDTALKLAQAQLVNNIKYSTGFDYETTWLTAKRVVSMYYIDIKQAQAIEPIIEGAE